MLESNLFLKNGTTVVGISINHILAMISRIRQYVLDIETWGDITSNMLAFND